MNRNLVVSEGRITSHLLLGTSVPVFLWGHVREGAVRSCLLSLRLHLPALQLHFLIFCFVNTTAHWWRLLRNYGSSGRPLAAAVPAKSCLNLGKQIREECYQRRKSSMQWAGSFKVWVFQTFFFKWDCSSDICRCSSFRALSSLGMSNPCGKLLLRTGC